MLSRISCAPAALALVLSLILLPLMPGFLAGQEAPAPATVRIGAVRALFNGVPEPMIKVASKLFQSLVEAQTGHSAELILVPNADQLATDMAAGKLHLGVFHGIYYGWARQDHPQLSPLVLVINQYQELHAHVVVRKDRSVEGLHGLRGKSIALPRGGMEHCRVFLDRRCQATGDEPLNFFSEITAPATTEDALDDVVDGVVQSAVVDGLALRSYERRKPGRFARLTTIVTSEPFPAAVVVYQPGRLPQAVLHRFRDGLLQAGQSAGGQRLLTLWRITAFVSVHEHYERTLTEITKAYPRALPVVRKSPPATETVDRVSAR